MLRVVGDHPSMIVIAAAGISTLTVVFFFVAISAFIFHDPSLESKGSGSLVNSTDKQSLTVCLRFHFLLPVDRPTILPTFLESVCTARTPAPREGTGVGRDDDGP
jgi:hypothetical protein